MTRPTYRYLHTGYPCVLVRLKDDRAHVEAQGRPLDEPGTEDQGPDDKARIGHAAR